jgi:hypothetical protein
MAQFLLNAVAAPSTPASGKATMFSDTNDINRPKVVQADGRVELLTRRSVAENFLTNGGFRFAQRQSPSTLTNYTAANTRAYGADRWGMTVQTSSLQYQRIDSIAAAETGLVARYYGKLKQVTGAGKFILSQILEGDDVGALRGQTVRVQAKMKFTVAASMTVRLGLLYLTSSGTVDTIPNIETAFGANSTDPTWGTNLTALAPTNPDGGTVSGLGLSCVLTGSWVRYSATFVVPSNCKNLIAVVWSDSQLNINDEFNVSEFGLYDGQEIIDWSPPLDSDELLRCQRYFQKSFLIDIAPAQNLSPTTSFRCNPTKAGANAGVAQLCNFKTRMRIAPTITTYNPNAANAQWRDATAVADCSGVATIQTDGGVGIGYTGNAATAIGNNLLIDWSAEAEL